MASIPMTQSGARALNHSPNDDAEAEYDRLRDLARQEAAKRSSCFDRAHQAYERGDGAEAKHLSDEGKRHASAADDYNRQASEYIFRENNASAAGNTIDLHGQFADEAERILEARIRADQARGQSHLHVIVGRGNHSRDHVQRIKPRVEDLCRRLGLHYATEENEGRVYVDLSGAPVTGPPPPLPQQPAGGYGGGYPGRQQGQQYYPQQQQQSHHHPHQHQQQQQPQDEAEQMVETLLPKLLRKMCGSDSCCVVM